MSFDFLFVRLFGLKNLENTEENSEKIGKIWKKIEKFFGKYGRKAS
jgi:hypothetical protein